MIEAKNVTKKFKEKIVFENLSFTVSRGSMTVITGESGAGKTTVLNCLGQLEKIDEGEILVEGKRINRGNLKNFFRDYAGFLFQNFALIDNESVNKNLQLVTKDKKKIMAALKQFQAEHLFQQKVFRLSGGEQQRVALARLYLQDPRIIFADEPTASLDQKNKEIVIRTLKELNKKGKTVIVVSHDLELANRLGGIIDMATLVKQPLTDT